MPPTDQITNALRLGETTLRLMTDRLSEVTAERDAAQALADARGEVLREAAQWIADMGAIGRLAGSDWVERVNEWRAALDPPTE